MLVKPIDLPTVLPKRRSWLAQSLVGLASVALCRGKALAVPPIERVGGPHFKTSLNIYSFLELLNENLKDSHRGKSLMQVCEFAAQQNFDAVDLTGYFFPGYPATPERTYVSQLKRRLHEMGLDISGTGVSNDFCAADKSIRQTGVEITQRWIEVAAELGAPTIRVFAGPRPPYKDWESASGNAKREDVERWMVDDLRTCAEHGQRYGVIVAVQNHADFIKTGAEHLQLIQSVNHPWCRALIDTGKYQSQDPYADMALVIPHAVNWQIKETLGSSVDSPAVDLIRLMRIIRSGGYRGYLPIETLSMKRKDYDPHVEVIKTLTALRAAITATATE